jgi:hypothetical protein
MPTGFPEHSAPGIEGPGSDLSQAAFDADSQRETVAQPPGAAS